MYSFEVGLLFKKNNFFLIAGGSGVFPLPSSKITSTKTLSKHPSVLFKERNLKFNFYILKNSLFLLPRVTSHCPVTPEHTR